MEENNIVEEQAITAYELWQEVIQQLYDAYNAEEDFEKKQKLYNNLLQAMDRLAAMEEITTNQQKNVLDNETKLKMNRNDNDTKLRIAQIENEMRLKEANIRFKGEVVKSAIDGATSLLDIGKNTAMGLTAIALQGASMTMECNGYAPGRSNAYRLATNMGQKYLKG